MRLKYRLVITEPAESDLREIADELIEPTTARKMIVRISEAAFQWEQMPSRNRLVRDERVAANGIRHLLVDVYVLFYVISEKEDTVTFIWIIYLKRK
ncbi:type II toxin-antitoxin system RelE/ParE family toxin [Paenibacillus sp. HWE-109]|uniref:type II toxin-antitoxin system RelE/ParE family toxin n=1 Tax=Paenibacillus sp. HWE-109 TaxID=1306526 RepID=UPI001EDED8E1|nr:type II toxin-antitoxin system RelE/ParE family toxin [Paenibacillus sp. HWE-109]UKS24181.1 type II toxin-antitoxin system RelE/ParE family toxin [Paenibacillus sp. HWE-109]